MCQYSQLTFLSSTLFPYSQFSKGRSGSEPASAAAAVPLERKSSQPQKKPETVAPATPATTGGAAAAAVSPSPVTSPEAGTDSEAAKGNNSSVTFSILLDVCLLLKLTLLF